MTTTNKEAPKHPKPNHATGPGLRGDPAAAAGGIAFVVATLPLSVPLALFLRWREWWSAK